MVRRDDDGAGASGATRPLGRAGRPPGSGSDPGPEAATTGTEQTVPSAIPAAAIGPGTMLGRYEVVSKLGEGGMGVVLLATDPVLGRKIALKLLHQDLGEHAEGARRRLLREAQGTAQLSHDNVITVHEVGTHDGRVFLAMEYVAGTTLTAWQRGKGWREIIAMYARAGRGLYAAHEAGLVHRDFKPDNVLVGDDGRVRVTDFGLVAAIDADAPQVSETGAMRRESLELAVSLTRTGSIMGTPRYMAPEQHLGLAVDARADQFAFCVALYEALYRQPPFAGGEYTQLLARVLDGVPAPVPADTDVPAAIGALVLRGLHRDHAARHPSLRALVDALVEVAERPAPRRRGWLPVALAAGAAATAAAVVIVVARPRAPERSASVAIDAGRPPSQGGAAMIDAAPATALTPAADAGAPDPIAQQIAVLRDPASPVAARQAAVAALASSSEQRAKIALLQAADADADPAVRKAAARALAKQLDLIASLELARPKSADPAGPGGPRGGGAHRDPPENVLETGVDTIVLRHGLGISNGEGGTGHRDGSGSGSRTTVAPPPPPGPPGPRTAPWARGVSDARQREALARFTAANRALLAGDAAGAEPLYREALARWDHPAIHFNLATLYAATGDRARAATEAKAALAYPAALDRANAERARALAAR